MPQKPGGLICHCTHFHSADTVWRTRPTLVRSSYSRQSLTTHFNLSFLYYNSPVSLFSTTKNLLNIWTRIMCAALTITSRKRGSQIPSWRSLHSGADNGHGHKKVKMVLKFWEHSSGGIDCDWERECWEQKTLWGNHTSTKMDFKLNSAYMRIQEYHSCNGNKKLQEGMNTV